MKVLNLYAGIGGNRKLWTDCEVTAVEDDQAIAGVYKDFFPEDNVVITDAHEYLREHFNDYDFIWSSPPCQSHASMRQNLDVRYRGTAPIYPSMELYQEIIFLRHNFSGHWVVENVNPYYVPLMPPTFKLQRHLFWSSGIVCEQRFPQDNQRSVQIPELQDKYDFDLSKYQLPNKRQVLRNCTTPEVGRYIFESLTTDTYRIYNTQKVQIESYKLDFE